MSLGDKLTFRNDDVCPSTDYQDLFNQYTLIKERFPYCRIISGVSLIGVKNRLGSVYPGAPFKDMPVDWFYIVDSIMKTDINLMSDIASHGLFHVDHSKISKDAQEMSILGSCNLLDTKVFIPPFNRYNEDTLDICKKNNIEIIIPSQGWLSLEFNDFNEFHKLWYFHSWRLSNDQMKGIFNGNRANLGQL